MENNDDKNEIQQRPLAPTRAIIYLRVSTKDQAERGGTTEGFSIPAQRDVCIKKAKALGATVVEEFADLGESAKTTQRPELQRLLAYVIENQVEYVIVHKVDRLARNRLGDALISMEITKSGAALVSCTENIDETPSGLLMHGIMSSISEFYSRNLANEVIKGSVQKAMGGGTIGRAATGYLNVRKVESGVEIRTVEVDPVRGPLMQWAFEEYATGQWSMRTLLTELTARGLDSVATRQQPSKPLVLSNFHRLLRHPYYKGTVRYRGVEYEGKHPPLVSIETWDRVQAVLDAQNVSGEKQRDHHHYLKGSVYCGQCGSRLAVSKNRGRRGKVYEYFICLGRKDRRTTCTQQAIRIEATEELVADHYRTVQPTPELRSQIQRTLADDIAANRQLSKQETERQGRRIRKLEDERAKLLEGYYAGAIPLEVMKVEQHRIAAGIKAATSRLHSLTAECDTVEANLQQAVDLAANWHEAYLRANNTERRLLNQAIFEKLYITHEGRVYHEFADPFDLLLGETAVRTAVERVDQAVLTTEESQGIDQAWAELSARWAADEAARRVRESHSGRSTELDEIQRTPDNREVVGGSYATLLVGCEGLEPPTPSV